MINTSQIYNQGDRERPRGEECEMPPYCRLSLLVMILTVVRVLCEARVLKAWYGCAMPGLHAQLLSLAVRKATKAGHGGLGTRLQWQTFTTSTAPDNDKL